MALLIDWLKENEIDITKWFGVSYIVDSKGTQVPISKVKDGYIKIAQSAANRYSSSIYNIVVSSERFTMVNNVLNPPSE